MGVKGANEVPEELDHWSSVTSKIYLSRLLTFNFLNQLPIRQLSGCTRLQSVEVAEELDRLSSLTSKIYPSRLQVTFNFLNQLTSFDLSLCRRFQSLDELPTGLQAMDASNTTSLVWIFTGLNWELSKQLQCFGCSKVLKKNRTSNPKNKLLNELIATDSFSVFRPGGEFPDWFDALVLS
ncbi:uncharacterized protein LOC115988942 [Quercus lobata]|uniref:uncharacterized protein LOC115988942 n=1 Tax=Quercus lobata TaxID=97700 RepID=UPI001247B3A3|nr:uncharacterized protein LOC115988942 [Quercus lobata]